jgi:hypothetical protein
MRDPAGEQCGESAAGLALSPLGPLMAFLSLKFLRALFQTPTEFLLHASGFSERFAPSTCNLTTAIVALFSLLAILAIYRA